MKLACSETRSSQELIPTEPVILFSISGQTFAASASAVHEIRSTNAVSAGSAGVPPIVPKVQYLLRRAGETFFVVSGWVHFGLPQSPTEHVLIFRNSAVALLVESIERMTTISRRVSLPVGFSGPERTWYRGVTIISGDVIPIINPSGLLTQREITAVRSGASKIESQMESNGQQQGLLAEQMQ